MQGQHGGHHKALGGAAAVTLVLYGTQKAAVRAILTNMAVSHQNAVGAQKPKVVQSHHHGHALGLGGAKHAGADAQ